MKTKILAFLTMFGSFLVNAAIEAPVKLTDWQKLEGGDNHGTATLVETGAQAQISGAMATPLALGGVNASLSSQVRFLMPEQGKIPEWASAAIALYGKDRGKRLYAMVIFGSPGKKDGQCDVGFYNRTMVPMTLPLGKWHTLKVEAADGLVRMKVWADGSAEPGWMVEDELADTLPGIDAVGVRTYGMPVGFEGFQARGTPAAEVPPAPGLTVKDSLWTAELDRSGRFKSFSGDFGDGKPQPVVFRTDSFAGPTWYGRWDGGEKKLRLRQVEAGKPVYEIVRDGIRFRIEYLQEQEGRTAIVATATNTTGKPWKPETAGLQLGLDTWMEKWPDWNQRFFPTLLRCEKTHFWGYAMAPDGRILVIASPDPVASWSVDYNGGGHRIFTLNLDLLNAGPLPPRHPQSLDTLAPGETKSWKVFLAPCNDLQRVPVVAAGLAKAPMFQLDRYTLEVGEFLSGSLCGVASLENLVIRDPNGKEAPLQAMVSNAVGSYQPMSGPLAIPGHYTLTATDVHGKVSEATITVRQPWSWYLGRARAEAVAKPQKGSSHTESWYGLFPAFSARRLLPDAALDAQAEAKFQEIMPLMYDMQKMRPSSWQDRIQNHACMAGLLAERYAATKDPKDLEFAASLCDFLGTKQGKDGAYRNGHTHYTSVVYIGKSIMEVMAQEKPLAATDPKWKERYDRHYASVQRAMDDLAKNLDNIDTEGELTYEDGMIACSYTQLSMFALLQEDPAARRKYLEAAEKIASGHRCLSQILVPDSRMNGGSLRFWEAQYDVLLHPNMFNSPHGWSGWRIYGLWYLYQLTGKEEYLRQAMNALGSCVQLIDGQSGELRWAFVPNPYVRASVFEPDPEKPGKGRRVNKIIGEQYMPMISGWYKAPPKTWVTGYWGNDGGCCDNDVHEIFKCLAEIAIDKAYLVQRANGRLATWNGTVKIENGTLVFTPAEKIVSRIHVNLAVPAKVRVEFAGQAVERDLPAGLAWIEGK